MKRRWVFGAALTGWLALVTAWAATDKFLRWQLEPAFSMEECVAGAVWSNLCYDRHWREHWVPLCDLCLPGMEKLPSQAQYDHDCRLDVIRESCVPQVAQSQREQQDQQIAAAIMLAVAYLGPPITLALPFLCWTVLRRWIRRPDLRRHVSAVERAPR
jgi:hypothetical protein